MDIPQYPLKHCLVLYPGLGPKICFYWDWANKCCVDSTSKESDSIASDSIAFKLYWCLVWLFWVALLCAPC